MILKDQDCRLVNAHRRLAWLLPMLSEMETDFVSRRLDGIVIDRPVFVTGLARSGTTILLTLLSKATGVATHRYRDFPFLETPFLWSWFQNRFARPAAPAERAHGDGIEVTGESPEAYEEPIWCSHIGWLHDPERVHCLEADFAHRGFEHDYRLHLRKILALRSGRRYLSKGNYNVTRIRYLAKLFPDAHFLVPVREPLAHVHSLVRQHRRFCAFSAEDPRLPGHLAATGHYEFGPQRVAINVRPEDVGRVAEAWSAGNDYRGYARQWAQIYRYVDALRHGAPELAGRLTVVCYESLCADPRRVVPGLCDAAKLADEAGAVADLARTVAAPRDATGAIEPADRQAVEEETADVAARFGYGADNEAEPRESFTAR